MFSLASPPSPPLGGGGLGRETRMAEGGGRGQGAHDMWSRQNVVTTLWRDHTVVTTMSTMAWPHFVLTKGFEVRGPSSRYELEKNSANFFSVFRKCISSDVFRHKYIYLPMSSDNGGCLWLRKTFIHVNTRRHVCMNEWMYARIFPGCMNVHANQPMQGLGHNGHTHTLTLSHTHTNYNTRSMGRVPGQVIFRRRKYVCVHYAFYLINAFQIN